MNKKRAKTSNNNKFSSKVIENLKNRPWGYPWADLARNGAIVSIFALATLQRQENRRSDVFQIRHIQCVQSVVEKLFFWAKKKLIWTEQKKINVVCFKSVYWMTNHSTVFVLQSRSVHLFFMHLKSVVFSSRYYYQILNSMLFIQEIKRNKKNILMMFK